MMKFKAYLNELLHADSITDVLMENRKETVKLAAVLVVILMVVLLYMHQSDRPLEVADPDGTSGAASGQADRSGAGSENGEPAAEGAAAGIDTDGIVYVDIDGAVKHPMLAELPSGSRVEDAIEAAGGLKKDADLTQVNRAALLTDGEKIYIPAEGETASAAASSAGASSGASSGGTGAGGGGSGAQLAGISGGKININTADVVLLQQLTGVGPVTAQKIVDYREQNGNFTAIEDLKKVSGIGDKTFEKMQDDITI